MRVCSVPLTVYPAVATAQFPLEPLNGEDAAASPLQFLDGVCGFPGGGVLSPKSCYAGGAVMTALDRQNQDLAGGSETPFSDVDIFVQCRHAAPKPVPPEKRPSNDKQKDFLVTWLSCACGCAEEWRRLLCLFQAQLPDCVFHVYHTANVVNIRSPALGGHEIQMILTDKKPWMLIRQFDMDATRCAVLHDGSVLATADQVLARTDRRVRVYAKRTLPYRWHKIRTKGYAIPAYLDPSRLEAKARARIKHTTIVAPHGGAITDVSQVMQAFTLLRNKDLNYFEQDKHDKEKADCVGVTGTTVRWLRPDTATESMWVNYEVGIAPTGRDGPIWALDSATAELELIGSVCGRHTRARARASSLTFVWLTVSATLYTALLALFGPLVHRDHVVSSWAAPPETNAQDVVTDSRLTSAYWPPTPFHGANTLVLIDYSNKVNNAFADRNNTGAEQLFKVHICPKACRDEFRTSSYPLLLFRVLSQPQPHTEPTSGPTDTGEVSVPEGLYRMSTLGHQAGKGVNTEEGSRWWLRSDRSGTLQACTKAIDELVYAEPQAADATRTFWPRTGFPTVLQLRQSVLPWHPSRHELFPEAYRHAAEWLLHNPHLPVDVWQLVLTYTTRDWNTP